MSPTRMNERFTLNFDEVERVRGTWKLFYEQPNERHLVVDVAGFLTHCAQFHPNRSPDEVLQELADSGSLATAPAGLLAELEQMGVVRMEGVKFSLTALP